MNRFGLMPPPPRSSAARGLSGDANRKTASRRRVDSESLFMGAHELEITHKGEVYRLHVTRNEKLILTK